jgi:predicted dehydrogenase
MKFGNAAMNSQIKWGVIGSGGIARRRTIPDGLIAAQNAQLIAVYDLDSTANAEVAREYKVPAAASVAELLGMGIDAVYIASPPAFHCAQALECSQAGKHVLCEKPLGLDLAEAEGMVAIFEEHQVRLGTAFMMRFHAQHQAALEFIQAGRLGQPVFARAQLSCWYPPITNAWRQDPRQGGGGALMDMGGHCIDLLEMFFGPVHTVSCFTSRTIQAYPVEDSAIASLKFVNGALGVVDTFFCLPDDASQNRLELYGSKGSILASGTIGQGDHGDMRAFHQDQACGYDARQNRNAGATVSLSPAPVNPYRAEIEEFSQAILENREPANHARLGLQSQRVLAAAYESARSGKAIPLRS